MKKLLSILAAVGLTATTAGSAVACTDTVKAKDVKVNQETKTASFTTTIKLTEGTIMVADPQNTNLLEIVPYKVTNDGKFSLFMGIVMKPEKEVKLKETVSLAELNNAAFFVSRDKITDVVQKQIGTNNNAFVLTKATEAEVQVSMDLSKVMSEEPDKLVWTLVDLNQTDGGYEITGIQERIMFDIDGKAEPTPATTTPTNPDSEPVNPDPTPEEPKSVPDDKSESDSEDFDTEQVEEVVQATAKSDSDSESIWSVLK